MPCTSNVPVDLLRPSEQYFKNDFNFEGNRAIVFSNDRQDPQRKS
jgi:hypothetical protein